MEIITVQNHLFINFPPHFFINSSILFICSSLLIRTGAVFFVSSHGKRRMSVGLMAFLL